MRDEEARLGRRTALQYIVRRTSADLTADLGTGMALWRCSNLEQVRRLKTPEYVSPLHAVCPMEACGLEQGDSVG